MLFPGRLARGNDGVVRDEIPGFPQRLQHRSHVRNYLSAICLNQNTGGSFDGKSVDLLRDTPPAPLVYHGKAERKLPCQADDFRLADV